MHPAHPNVPGQPPGQTPKYPNYADPAYVQGLSKSMATSSQAPSIHVIPNGTQQNLPYGYTPYPYLNTAAQQNQRLFPQEKVHVTGFPLQTTVPGNGNVVLNQVNPARPGIPEINPRALYGGTRSVSLASQYSNEAPATHGLAQNAVVSPKPKVIIVDQTKMGKHAVAGSGTKIPATRKRSSTACDTCRQKKIKCDNLKPRCGACSRNNNTPCHYSIDGMGLESWLLDVAYNDITSKLDIIMEELREQGKGPEPYPLKKRKVRAPKKPRVQYWDASFTSLLKWPYLQQQLGIDCHETSRHIRRIVSAYEVSNLPASRFGSVQKQLDATSEVEADFHKHFSSHLNAFLINSHTKVPFLDLVELIELLEVFTLIKKANDLVSLPCLLQEFYALKNTEPVGQLYSSALKILDIEDSKALQKAYRALCESVSVILMVCAIGVISAPVSLDNIGTYANSLEERSSPGPKNTTKQESSVSPNEDRFSLSQKYVNYVSVISAMFPQSLKPYSIVSVKYHVLLSQYYHYTLNPVMGYEEIINACNHLVFQIEKLELQKNHSSTHQSGISYDDALINRLYWTCLKLECELRVEMSPHVPFSFITQITPPSSFFRIPDPFQESEHTRESIRIANSYDDQNTWYYFLTEIAVRKLENNMLDEIYPVWLDHFHWDNPDFTSEKIWKLTIKYLTHLDCIVKSLTPSIREFVLLEKDPALVYESIKRKANKRKKYADGEEKVPQILEDFLVNEDLLHQAQSESVIFIKTRLLTSKMLLMRPLVYMYLHDHILFDEILEAATEVLATNQRKQFEDDITNYPESPRIARAAASIDPGSEGSIYLLAAALKNLNQDNEEDVFDATQFKSSYASTRQNRPDDFSDLMEYAENVDELEMKSVVNYEDVRKRILRWFVGGLISIPKLNIPKIGLFRHPGSGYYIRNLILGVVMQFLIFKKTQGYVAQIESHPIANNSSQSTPDPMQILGLVFRKEHVQEALEYALLIIEYWKEERKDCVIYAEYLRQCLDRL